MLKWLFKATLFISVFPVQTAVAQEILRTEMVLNPADSHEIQNAFDIGFLFYMKNGDTLMTKGFLNGTVGWNELDVSSSRMLIYHGWCSFSRYQLQLFNYNVDITVRSKRHGLLLQDTFVIPHVQRLEITNETPTVFPGEDLRLNIKTHFSNGSVYSVLDDNLFNFSDFKYYLDSTQIDPSQFYVPYRVDSPQFLNLKVEYRYDKRAFGILKLPIAYDQVCRLDFSGMPGADGENGVDGKIDLDNGALRHGTDGQHGQS
ncbi:MAG: hypothetical protein KDC92_13495, partial [Bacteroidetes bacterium]|nr:hypothetical protein [Bacteroidota bacterium]